jgi:hypothetical protein
VDPAIQDVANVAAATATSTATDPTSQGATTENSSTAAAIDSTATDPTSQGATENSSAAAAIDSTATDPTSQGATENSTAPPPPIPPGYWDSPQARDLFQPRPEEGVETCLWRRIELFNSVLNDWSRLNEVLEGDEDTVSRLTDHQKQRLTYKCMYLRLAYEKALLEMGRGVSWKKCTELALVEISRLGFSTFSRPRLLADMNQDFRSMELFSVAHGVSKGFQGSELFQIFPEARRMLLAWASNNLEKLNSETAREYLLAEKLFRIAEQSATKSSRNMASCRSSLPSS